MDSLALERGLTGVKDRLRTVNTEMRKNMSEFDRSDRSIGKYETRLDGLNKKLQVQEKVTEESRKEYEKMVQEYGAGSKEAEKAERNYNNQAAALNNLERYVDKTTEELEEMRKEQERQESTWGKFSTQLDKIGTSVTNLGEDMTKFGKSYSKRVTAPILALGGVAFAAADNVEKAYREIRIGTGATGDDLEDLKESFHAVFEDVPDDAESVATALSNVNTYTGWTGDVLEDLTRQTMDAARTMGEDGVEASTAFGKALNNWNIPAEESEQHLDHMYNLSQTYGVGLAELSSLTTKHGTTLKNAGFEMDEVAHWMATLEANGISVTRIMPGLNQATRKWADENKDAKKELDKVIKSMQEAEDDTEALSIATETFGSQGAQRMVDAVRNGALPAIEDLGEMFDESSGIIEEATEETRTIGEEFQILKNKTVTALEPLGRILIDTARDVLPPVIEGLTGVAEWFNELEPSSQTAIVAAGGVVAAIGPLAVGFGGLLTAIGPVITAMAGAGGFAAALGLLTNPIGLTLGALATLGGGFLLLDSEMEKPIIQSEIFSDEISEATQKAVGSYMELDENATAELQSLSWSQAEITDEMKDNMIATYDEMYNTVLQAMRENHEEQLEEQRKLFEETAIIEEEEAARRMAKLKADQLAEEEELTENQARIKEIWQTAADERRGITDAEAEEIAHIQEQMKLSAVEELTESQEEQIVILDNMKNQKGVIEAETAANTVSKSIETRDKVVDEANTRYNETVSAAESGRDELGTISAEEADAIIEEAEKQRADTVLEAERKHNEVLMNAKSQASQHVEEVNWETGEVLSRWDKLYNGIADIWNPIADLFNGRKMQKRGVRPPRTGNRGGPNAEIKAAYADGTYEGTHPGGLALVGEEGYELGYIPNAGYTMLGAEGPEITNLPRGAAVLPHKETKSLLKKYNLPAYADGTDDTTMFSWLFDGAKTLWDNMLDFTGFFDKVTMPDWFISINDIMNVISDGFISKIGELKDNLFSIGPSGGSGTARWAGVATTALRMTGQYSPANLNRLLYQMGTESGGNPQAINLWDINAQRGIPSKGLMQVIDPTFAAYKMPGFNDIWNPLDNMLASIRYATSRYGNLSAAYRGVGYEKGGFIDREHLAMVGEGDKAEVVIPLEQHRDRAVGLWQEAGRRLGISGQAMTVLYNSQEGVISNLRQVSDDLKIQTQEISNQNPLFERIIQTGISLSNKVSGITGKIEQIENSVNQKVENESNRIVASITNMADGLKSKLNASLNESAKKITSMFSETAERNERRVFSIDFKLNDLTSIKRHKPGYVQAEDGSLVHGPSFYGYATGGYVETPQLAWLAEEGWPEFVIPTDPKRRTDAMKLLALAGKEIQGNKRPNHLPNISTKGNNNSRQLENVIDKLTQQVQLLTELVISNQQIANKPVLSEGDINRANQKMEAREYTNQQIFTGRTGG